jgi:hypothetical protein
MKRALLIIAGMLAALLAVYGQNTSVTNNNTVVINGDVYYFRPSTTPSSPQPRVGSSDFISYGRWYGADAARAWASIADWAIEHCEAAEDAVKADKFPGMRNGRVYISSVEAKNEGYGNRIVIYYWLVPANDRMEDGFRTTRTFYFN